VGQGASLEAAIKSAYALVKQVRFDKMYFRKDIAQKGLKK
jgi:phosphoribosylamine-glycine ligase